MYIREASIGTFAASLVRLGCVLTIFILLQADQSSLMGQAGSNVQSFPRVILNQGATTSFTILNPSSVDTIRVEVLIYSSGRIELNRQQVNLGPGATETVVFGDVNLPLVKGSAELTSTHEFLATE